MQKFFLGGVICVRVKKKSKTSLFLQLYSLVFPSLICLGAGGL